MRPASWAIIMRPETCQNSPRNHPTVCLVTDRRRLAAALGIHANGWRDALLQQIAGAVAGGIDIIQLREGDLEDQVLVALARDCLRISAGTRTRIVINDRVDIARASGAHGVHLREDGIAPVQARRLGGPTLLIGRSVHSAHTARASVGADYLIAGPVFATASKTDHPGIGPDGFRAIVASAQCPVWAIGGVTPARGATLAMAGAEGVAAIGALMPTGPVPSIAASVQHLVEDLRFAFDSPSGVS
jgi:thiamine-phosphate pyrophosphorylase